MGIAVLAFWAVLILFITGAFHTSSIDLEPESDVASAVNSGSDLAVAEVTSTAPAPSETTTVANDPLTPTATPVPAGPIATIYDEQIRKDPDNATLYLQRGSVYLMPVLLMRPSVTLSVHGICRQVEPRIWG